MNRSGNHVTASRSVLVLFVIILISGCTSVKKREYAPFVRDLDGKNELIVSTYPAGLPDEVSQEGATFEAYETHGELYFQVFVRDRGRSIGSSPELESMRIHSFSYRLDDGPLTELLSGYTGNFWMQGNRRYEQRDLPPILYRSDGVVFIEINFELNGTKYAFEGEMPARASSVTVPTFIKDGGI